MVYRQVGDPYIQPLTPFPENEHRVAKRSRLLFPSKRRRAGPASVAALMSVMARSTTQAITAASKITKAATKTTTRPARKTAAQPAPRARGGAGRFTAGTHAGASGSRTYKLFMPRAAGEEGATLPLLVMLHGCGQTPDDFAKGTRMNLLAEELGVIVLYPAQPRSAHPNRCWNWFRASDQGRDAGEMDILAGMVRAIQARHPVDPRRIYAAGLSAGASCAMLLAHAYPEIFAAVGCHSGLPINAARDKGSAVLAIKQGWPGTRLVDAIPTIVFHGEEDKVVTPRNGRLVALRALETYRPLATVEKRGAVADGRAYIRTQHRIGRGRAYVEHWLIKGSGHAWSGGSRTGRFVDPSGPDASREMLRFFLKHKNTRRT